MFKSKDKPEKDWKAKYFNSLDDLEKIENQLTELDELIDNTARKLMVLIECDDDEMKAYLESLKAAVAESPLNPSQVSALLDKMGTRIASMDGHERSTVSNDAVAIHNASELFETMIARLGVSNELEERRQKMEAQAQSIDSLIAAFQLADDFLELINDSRHRLLDEKNELNTFLRELQATLLDFGSHLDLQQEQLESSSKDRQAMIEAVDGGVSGITESMSQATDLIALKDTITGRLELIRNQVESFEVSEGERLAASEEQSRTLKARVSNLEKESTQLRAELMKRRQQMMHDPLTKIFNRLALNERLTIEVTRWRRYKTPLSILIVDIDFFKRVNDDYGHQSGDKALQIVAARIKKNIRDSDFLARYGGEEFVVLMPQTELDQAYIVAEKLRLGVEEMEFHYSGKQVKITVSVGITEFEEGDDAKTAFERSDKALYEAKGNGRNQCVRK